MYTYKLIHKIDGKTITHIEKLYHNDINRAYKYFKNTLGNKNFISLSIIK